MPRFAYYLLRVGRTEEHSAADQPDDLQGLAERLGTGEKRQFSSGDELLEFLREPAREPQRPGAGSETDLTGQRPQPDGAWPPYPQPGEAR